MPKIDVAKIDQHLTFLRREVSRLGEHAGTGWAERNLTEMKSIIETLTEMRRAMQMTTMSGKPLE